jgi:hypothetical protein
MRARRLSSGKYPAQAEVFYGIKKPDVVTTPGGSSSDWSGNFLLGLDKMFKGCFIAGHRL